MKGARFLYDETNKKHLIEIDLEVLVKHRSSIEDLFDIIHAERNKNDEMIPWKEAKKMLKRKGKL